MKKISINKIITGVLLLSMVTIAQAAAPLWTFTPDDNFPPVVNVSSTGSATIKYIVQNHSSKPHSLVIEPIQGISQTAPCDVKGKGTCDLVLTVTGSALPTNGVSGGPSLCQKSPNGAPNPNQCYQPTSPGKHLQVTKVSGPIASITVNPNLLNLTVNGAFGQVTVQNTSATTAVEGLTALIPPGSQVTVDPSHTTCTNTLPENQSCIFAFLPGNTVEHITIEITGSNVTAAVPVTVNVSSASQATITVNPNQLNLTVNGTSGQVSVQNTSATTAVEGLTALIPAGSQITVASSTTCTNTLPANQSCIFGFLPGNVAEDIFVTISGSNTASGVPVRIIVTNNTMSSLAFVGASTAPYVNRCTITNGSFNTACQPTGDYNFTQSIIQIVINSTGNKAYLVQFDSQGQPLPVIVCNITSQGDLTGCTSATPTTWPYSLLSLALNNNGKAYFTTNITPPANSSSLYSCDVDSASGFFINCNPIIAFDPGTVAPGITLNTSNQKAYVSYNSFIAGTLIDGIFECDFVTNSCIPRPMTLNFSNWFFGNLVLDPSNTYLYVVGNQDGDQSKGNIFQCNPSTSPMNCSLSFPINGNGIVFGSNIAFGEKIVAGHNQPQLYVTTPNTVTSCDLNNNGDLNNCTQGSATINGASGLAVNPNT
ncbi:hypothetical protein Lgra_2378 [Legionella gratiana]|uniref:Transmembrane protein (Fibronectin III domain and Gp5 C-terminal repeat) n=1 Tax=Legionella gratiana TaxID=45066 RepID=A0A378JCV6_9GAMM|nr:hypothetical protein [Legionella gratiana]KTD09143.1 hypothetical protein Lgra_2378 [Legionella gratiana]STX45643.1 transmembrane protein (fibronectin III domain and Gp5 C-terminal repeat) [Legionella gratiana]